MTDPSPTISETVRLRVRGTCPCGNELHTDDRLPEPAGDVSLARLVDLSLLCGDLARCLCGAWDGRRGDCYASYRLPGQGPWLVAHSRIEDQPRQAQLSVRQQLPDTGDDGRISCLLPSVELEAARRLGQPASARAAWTEALFDLTLGADTRTFPYGSGVRCVVTTDQNQTGTLDLAVLQQPDSWLPDASREAIARGDTLCLVQADVDVIDREIEDEARRKGLAAAPAGKRSLTLGVRRGRFTEQLDTQKLLWSAVGAGHALSLEASHELGRVAERLLALEENARELCDTLAPQAVRPIPDRATLVLDYPRASVTVDVGAYLAGDRAQRRQMLDSWRGQAR